MVESTRRCKLEENRARIKHNAPTRKLISSPSSVLRALSRSQTVSRDTTWKWLSSSPNRIRTGYGRFNANMNQMGLSPSASCECGATDQTAQHIASECPLHRCKGDLVVLDTAARNWLHDLQCDV